jgi:hypothetical protein
MSSRSRIRVGGGGQNQHTKRLRVAHPMERVLDGVQEDSDDRQKRLKELLNQFSALPQEQRKKVSCILFDVVDPVA